MPIGTGDVNYAALFRTLARDHTDIVVSVATHYQLPGGTKIDTMHCNYANPLQLVEQAQAAINA